MVRVLLADDDAVIRAGVRAILSQDIEVVGEAANGRDAVDLVRAHRPDVVLLDIRMPVLDGLAATEELRTVAPDTAVLIMTTFDEDAYVARALRAGASGFLLKTGDPREFALGVRAAADGGAYLSPPVARRVIAQFGGDRARRADTARQRVDGLSGREREVLRLVGEGLSNAEIARRLHVVEGTVKAHVSAILGRLELKNRVQAAILAYEAGLVGAGPA
ncbi:response regulator transcription factor [Saccharopolyspora cebuensis]|uniref:Response regulator n=1 Tax=Saccharopolyspora cebuensis TaxID=418759 RepID=A0ABV4CPP6_9PSEU